MNNDDSPAAYGGRAKPFTGVHFPFALRLILNVSQKTIRGFATAASVFRRHCREDFGHYKNEVVWAGSVDGQKVLLGGWIEVAPAGSTGRLISRERLRVVMTLPFDRDSEENPFRRMERLKAAKRAGMPIEESDSADIEAPIAAGKETD